MVSFAVENLLNLIRSYVFIFAFIFFDLGDVFKRTLLQEYSAYVFLLEF